MPFQSIPSPQISIVDFFAGMSPTIQQLRAGNLNSDASFLCIHKYLGGNRFSGDDDSRKPPSHDVLTSPSASRGIQDLDISGNQTKTPPNTPKEDDDGSNGDSEKPSSTWEFSAVSTGNIDTLKEYTQKIDRASKLVQHEGLCLCGLADILGKRLTDTLTPPLSSTSEAEEEHTNEVSGTIQVSKLEYKRVDEMYVRNAMTPTRLTVPRWNEKEGKFKIVEPVGSDLDQLDKFLFVVRERTGKPSFFDTQPTDRFADKNTPERTSYIDIKSPWIRDTLRETCENVRGVSLADSKPSVRTTDILLS